MILFDTNLLVRDYCAILFCRSALRLDIYIYLQVLLSRAFLRLGDQNTKICLRIVHGLTKSKLSLFNIYVQVRSRIVIGLKDLRVRGRIFLKSFHANFILRLIRYYHVADIFITGLICSCNYLNIPGLFCIYTVDCLVKV